MNPLRAASRCSLGIAAFLILALPPAPAFAAPQLTGAAAADAQLAELDADIPELVAPAFVSGSYSSTISTRVDRQGRIDTGLGYLEIVDGRTGALLDASRIAYTRGPGPAPGFGPAWWTTVDEGVVVTVQMATVPVTKSGDARMVNAVRIEADNPGDEAAVVPLGVRLRPGDVDADVPRTPWTHPFDPSTRYALVGEGDDQLLERDGMACLWWDGPEGEIVVHDDLTGPDDIAMEAAWTLLVPAGERRVIDVIAASPPCNTAVQEAAWREMAQLFGYRSLRERVVWEAEWRTDIEHLSLASDRMWRAMMASAHMLRLIAEGYNGLRYMTDKPYGHADVDFGVRAAVTASLHEWGMTPFLDGPLQYMLANLPTELPAMSPERRVAYLHGLTRIVRLIPNPEHDLVLANTIIESLQPGPVLSWQDPALVRADFEHILRRAGRSMEEWPALTWATVEPGTADAEFQAWRRAISASDGEAAWAAAKRVLGRTDAQGMGSARADGEPDGRFAHVFMHLTREMLLGDHGEDLLLFHAVPERLYPRLGKIDTYDLPSAFGTVRTRAWYVGGKGGALGFASLLRYKMVEPAHTYWRIPPGRRVKKIQEILGGTVEEVEPGLMNMSCDLSNPKGVNFLLRMERVED